MTDQGNMVALLNESFFYDDRCGLNALVVAGGRVRVKIVDVCPPTLCDENTNLALSVEAFSQIADPAAGKIFVDYSTSSNVNVRLPILIATVAAVDAWKHSDFLCKNYILNGLNNALYNVYSPIVNAKTLWESLERKYKTEDAGSKKFVVGKFLDFKMVDSKTVISQVQEFQLILHDIHAEGMVLGESFQVATLIEKLPPTWKDFKNYLKHKHKEMKLEDLIVRLRIEEDNGQSEKKAINYHQEAKANVFEQVDDIYVNTIMETRNARFFEDVFPYKVAQELSSLEITSMNQEPSQEEDEPRRSKRARTSTSFGPDFLTYLLENEPRTYSEAMSSPEAPYWKEAINSEIESIMQNHT
ncbi:hypothetical protein RJ639_036344 [Escallonia herrerae]|uniref:Uncharacterized protein n=1 Tax=Escallonia herrerae TaxID=1293975 RepID=A0AA88WZ90_9ASTE|nr:hypothetical protein RJ639_036344 [Escallonia herrerae]